MQSNLYLLKCWETRQNPLPIILLVSKLKFFDLKHSKYASSCLIFKNYLNANFVYKKIFEKVKWLFLCTEVSDISCPQLVH